MHSAKHEPSRDIEANVGNGIHVFLADTFLLMAKTQGCHWNVTGPNFISVHQLLESQYRELFEAVDQIAERARALRLIVPSGLLPLLELATLEEAECSVTTDQAARMLVADHMAMADQARDLAEEAEEAEDPATQDMLVGRIAVHEKAAWLLRSHIQ